MSKTLIEKLADGMPKGWIDDYWRSRKDAIEIVRLHTGWMPNWISVKEHLPENEQQVLVWRDLGKSKPGATAQVYDIEVFRTETACLNARWGITDITLRSCDVVAWMPLPAAPKDDQADRPLDTVGLPLTAQASKHDFRPHLPPQIVPNSDAICSLRCRHGCEDAILGVFYFPYGCLCFSDPIQALCVYHFRRAEQNMPDTRIVPLVTFS